VETAEYHLTPDEWTQVSFNVSSAIVVPEGIGQLVRAKVAGEEPPPLDTTTHFLISKIRLVRGIAPFQALWLRADAGPVTVTVYKGNSMTGVVYFGKSPFRMPGPSSTKIDVPFVPQTLDGGAPDTDYEGLAVIDCGGPIQDPQTRSIDGRSAGETP